ncbi:MAG: group I truncated hemoglobin [Janthinobacterium lividum]
MKRRLFLICMPCAAFALTATRMAFAQSTASDSLYRDLHGREGIVKLVDELMPILLADGRIKHSFVDVDMKHLAASLADQFGVVSGGPEVYKGKDMLTVHQDLKIDQAQFNALVEDLQLAMDRQGIPSSVQNRLLAMLAPMHTQIISR